MCVCMYIYNIHIHIFTYLFIFINIHLFIYIYIYVYIIYTKPEALNPDPGEVTKAGGKAVPGGVAQVYHHVLALIVGLIML